jgi:hypothetical protein
MPTENRGHKMLTVIVPFETDRFPLIMNIFGNEVRMKKVNGKLLLDFDNPDDVEFTVTNHANITIMHEANVKSTVQLCPLSRYGKYSLNFRRKK